MKTIVKDMRALHKILRRYLKPAVTLVRARRWRLWLRPRPPLTLPGLDAPPPRTAQTVMFNVYEAVTRRYDDEVRRLDVEREIGKAR